MDMERVLLRMIEAHELVHGSSPTVSELAADLGIPPEFGHRHLVEELQRQVELGHVSDYAGHVQLTSAGRDSLLPHEWRSERPPTETFIG